MLNRNLNGPDENDDDDENEDSGDDEDDTCDRCGGTGHEMADSYEDGEIVGEYPIPCPDCGDDD